MRTPEEDKAKFQESVGILVKAYLNDTLVHTNCYACAVGNLVAHYSKFSFVKCKDEPYRGFVWDKTDGIYCSKFGTWYETLFCKNETFEGHRQIRRTGYSGKQLVSIEKAFELAEKGYSEDDWMFNGLMAVVDVLAEIHHIDLKEREEAKTLFVRP